MLPRTAENCNERVTDFLAEICQMHHFSNKFSKIAKRWASPIPVRPFTFNFDGLKLSDLGKLLFFKLIMTESKFKKSVMTSFL